MMNATFVSCEDAMPPILGVRNFFAFLTSVPLMLVPLRACRLAVISLRSRRDGSDDDLVAWTCMLLGLFFTNMLQHTVGPSANYVHEIQAAVQGVFNASLLNTLRWRDGYWCPLSRKVARGVVASTTLGFAYAALTHPPWTPEVCGITQMLTGPFIVQTMGVLSYDDAVAWPLFRRSCAGLVLVHAAVGIESKVCTVPVVAQLYHAIVDHLAIVLLFGSVSMNAVHLTHRRLGDEKERLKERTQNNAKAQAKG